MTSAPVAAPRPLRRDAAANRDRLLAAAAEVFHEQGLSAGLDDVARRAGVGVGTLYRRFPHREDLLDALLTDLLERYVREAEQARSLPDGTGLAGFVHAVGEVQATARGCALRLWTSPAVEDLRSRLRAGILALIEDARLHGGCRDDVTVDDLIAVLVALRAVREAPDGHSPLDWRRHLDICLAGLRP